jgi:hypothetical protein
MEVTASILNKQFQAANRSALQLWDRAEDSDFTVKSHLVTQAFRKTFLE